MRSLYPRILAPGFVLVIFPVLQRLHVFIIDHIRIHGWGLELACNGGSCEAREYHLKINVICIRKYSPH